MAQSSSTLLPFLILVVVVIVAAGAGGGYIYEVNTPKATVSPFLLVKNGDNVTVNYVGIFGSGPDQGKVFDTSVQADALNNASYPKSLEYTLRPANGYTPLPVHVGPYAPGGQYSLYGKNFTTVVTGFWQGLLGVPGNQTHRILVPPEQGYGPADPACFHSHPLTVSVPVEESLTGQQFTAEFPGKVAATGGYFTDPTYGYGVYIFSANATSVTLINQATAGETSDLQGWPAEVVSVTSHPNGSGTITIENQITPADAGHILGSSGAAGCTTSLGPSKQFIISAVDLGNNTFTEDYNQEVIGQTLIFDVTVLDIYVPTTVVA